MKTKSLSKKSGISLIVLVITIIVIIILAVAVILSIANNNPIENAIKAKNKNNEATTKEIENMNQIDDILNGTELVYNKPAYDVKVNVWVYKMNAAGEYNRDTPVLKTYIMYPDYKSGDKVSLLKDICDKIKGENKLRKI